MQPRKSCSAVGSSVCCTACFPLPPALDVPLSPCPLAPATRHIEKKERFQLETFATTPYALSNECVYVLTMRSLGVRVDLRPGLVRHVGSRSLQLRQRVLHLRLALRRKENRRQTHSAIAAAIHFTTVTHQQSLQDRVRGALTKNCWLGKQKGKRAKQHRRWIKQEKRRGSKPEDSDFKSLTFRG